MEEYSLDVERSNPYENENPRGYSLVNTKGIAGYTSFNSNLYSFDRSCSGDIPLMYSVDVFKRSYSKAA